MNLFQIICVFSVFAYSGAVVKRQYSSNYYSSTPSYGYQYDSNQYGNTNMMYGTGQQGLDAVVFSFALPKLMGQLNQNDMMSLNQTISRLQGATGNQIVPVVQQWVNQLNPTTQQQVQSWLQDQMMATQMAQQKGTQLINQNNVSANVRNAWQRLQQLVMSMTVTSSQFSNQLSQIYNSLSQTDKRQFEQIFQQVYGYNYTQYFVPTVNNQAFQRLYQQNMGNGIFQDQSSYGYSQSGYNSNMGYNTNMGYTSPYGNTNQMMYNQNQAQYNPNYGYNTNAGYPYNSGANPTYGTQYSATGYASPYTFNSAYGRRAAYKRPPMAPMMPTP